MMKSGIALFVFCVAVAQAFAQPERPTGLIPTLRFSTGQENKSIVGTGEFSDTVFLVAPSFDALKRFTGTTELTFYYQPEFEIYAHNSDLNSLNHLGRITLTQKITPRLLFSIGDSFALTKDPSRQLANSFLMLPRSRYKENSLFFSADYSITARTSWIARFDNRVVRFGLSPEFRSGFLDQMGNTFSSGIAHTFTPQHRLSVTYSLLRVSLLETDGVPIDSLERTSNNHIVSATYGYTFNQGLNFSLSGGAIRSQDYSYLFGAHLAKRIGSMWLDVSYDRSIGFVNPALPETPGLQPGLSNGLLASNYYQMASAGLRGNITRRLGLDARAGIIKNSAKQTAFSSRSYMTLGRLNYRISDRVVLFTTAELYSQNLNELFGVPTRRTRFFGGLEIGLAPGSHPAAMFPGSGINRPDQSADSTQAREDK